VVKPATETYNALYSVQVNSVCGSWTDQINVNIRTPPPVNLGPDTILCASYGQYFLDAGYSPLNTYKWNTGSNWYGRYMSQTDTTWVAATNNCGTTIDTVVVQFDDSLKPSSFNDTLICRGDQFVMFGRHSGRDFTWFNGDTTDSVTIVSTGIKWVESRNACNTVNDTLSVGIEPVPVLSLPRDTAFCKGPTVFLSAFNPRSSYQWSTGLVDSSIVVKSTGNYTVTVTNKCGQASDNYQLTVDSALNLNIGNDTLICPRTQFQLYIGKSQSTQLKWFNGDATPQTAVSSAGKKWLRLENTCGVYSDTMIVGIEHLPVVDLTPDSTVCKGAQVTLNVFTPRSSYNWSTGSNDSAIVVQNTGKYKVTVTNKCGADFGSFQLRIDEELDVDLGPDTTLCDDGVLRYEFSFPNKPRYEWNHGVLDSAVTLTSKGRYILTVTNSCGSFTDDINLNFNFTPRLNIAGHHVLCEDKSLVIDATLNEWVFRGTTYRWNDELTERPQRILRPVDSLYWVEASNFCGSDRDTITLREQPLPRASLGEDTLLCDGETLLLDVSGENLSYQWQDDSREGTYLVEEAGEYTVRITDEYGCEWNTQIAVNWCEPKIWVPNAFSPNLDGKNEGFRAYSDYIYEYQIQVYNRWGGLLFEADNINTEWDGTDRNTGELAPSGVYSYKISYKRKDNQLRVKTGTVTLLR
jgi:gliding motility-associated-like protein